MLSFASITPHPPIIIPSVGKDNQAVLAKTLNSFLELEKIFIASKTEILLIISPHGALSTDHFSFNVSETFTLNFEDFGDFSTQPTFSGELVMPMEIKEKSVFFPQTKIVSNNILDHGSAVPLYFLGQKVQKTLKILPLYYCAKSLADHFAYGRMLKREILKNDKKIGIVASGDLSHRLTKNSPAGYSPKGQKFDNKLIELLKQKKSKEILDLNPDLIEEAGECGLRSIVLLLGILDNINCEPEIMSYEYPFGVGYLTANYRLPKAFTA
jgi:aromatic ring-opening dioxygenase LigB subunit